jgi:hypothetical protein
MTRFCCFPCVMPMKYLPWCFFAFLILFNIDFFTIVSCLLGYVQHMVLKKSLLQMPLAIYNKLESVLPDSVKTSPGFVSIRSVEANLQSICRRPGASPSMGSNDRPPQQQGNPFDNNEAMNDRVEVIGKGVSIGSSSPVQQANPSDYKSHWLKNMSDEQAQARKTEEISPSHKEEEKQENNLLEVTLGIIQLNHEHNETMMSDYPLNDVLDVDEMEEEK